MQIINEINDEKRMRQDYEDSLKNIEHKKRADEIKQVATQYKHTKEELRQQEDQHQQEQEIARLKLQKDEINKNQGKVSLRQ